MTVNKVITSVLGTEDFAQYEQSVYEKHQKMAEREMITQLNVLLSNACFLMILKRWGVGYACRFLGHREITVRLKSGQPWPVRSPVFLRAKPKTKRGRAPKRQQGALRHLGLEILGIIKQISPALIEVCVSMAVLCPSFEVAAQALRGFGITMNEHLLQNITHRFAKLAKSARVECHTQDAWQKPNLKILICVDGGRIRERCKKKGRRKSGQKRQGYTTEWFEPRLLTINQFDEEGKKSNRLAQSWMGHLAVWMIFLNCSSNIFYRSTWMKHQKSFFVQMVEKAFGLELTSLSANWALARLNRFSTILMQNKISV